MNKIDYNTKIETLLEDPTYKLISSDPTTYLEKTTKKIINSTPLDDDIKKKIIPREKSSVCPKFYGLPKIHKDNVPLRPIVSSIGSPTQELAKYLAQILQPQAEKIKSYVRNADHFLELIKEQQLKETDLLVSFDVQSLFTQIPVDEAITILEERHQLPEYFINLTKHCLKNTYFIYNNKRYKQIDGAPMGSPLSPIIANLYMESFEEKALNNYSKKPKLWLRYVDDTFVIWTHGRNELQNFLIYLNSIHQKIQFTMEVEEQNQLPFLDVLIKKRNNGTLSHTVYRKTTHTNRYLNAESHHHPAQLNSVVKTLITRSLKLADADHATDETNIIREALLTNGYTPRCIDRTIRNVKNPSNKQKEPTDKTRTALLPYIKGTTDKISKVLQKYSIDTVFTTDKTLGDILRNYKDKHPLEDQGVYEIPCRDCEQTYIGQTNRRIEVRREEHKLAIRNKQTTSSLFQHALSTGHTIDFNETKSIAKCRNLSTRITREAIEIEKRPNSLNKRDDTQRLSATWKPVLTQRCLIRTRDMEQHVVDSPLIYTDRTQNSPTNSQTQNTTGPITRSQTRKQDTPTAAQIQIEPLSPTQHSRIRTRSRRR